MAYIPNATDPTNPLDTVDRSTAAAEFRALKAYIQTLVTQFTAGGVQSGTILCWSGSAATLPAGYLVVPTVATNISRATYPNLFTVMQNSGFPYGSGDGSTTFGMPYIPADYVVVQANANQGTQTVGAPINHVHGPGAGTAFWTAGNGTFSLGGAGTTGSAAATANPTTGNAANLAAGVRMLHIVKT